MRSSAARIHRSSSLSTGTDHLASSFASLPLRQGPLKNAAISILFANVEEVGNLNGSVHKRSSPYSKGQWFNALQSYRIEPHCHSQCEKMMMTQEDKKYVFQETVK